MTNNQAIYYHGRLSLVCCSLVCATGVLAMVTTKAMFIATFGFALMTGWHIGHVAWRSLRP